MDDVTDLLARFGLTLVPLKLGDRSYLILSYLVLSYLIFVRAESKAVSGEISPGALI